MGAARPENIRCEHWRASGCVFSSISATLFRLDGSMTANPPLYATITWLPTASTRTLSASSPSGILTSVDWFALALSVAAAVAIFRFKVGMIPTLTACCIAGIVLYLVGATS
jgi:hypothetical protein